MSLEDQGASQEPRSANATVQNPDNHSTKPDETKIIKYSEITDDVDPENLNSDIVIEMHPASTTNSVTQISVSSSESDNKTRVSEISLDMQPSEVLVNNTDVSSDNHENPDPDLSVLSANRSDE